MNNYEKLVEKTAEWLCNGFEWGGTRFSDVTERRTLHWKDLAQSLLTTIFTPAQIEALKQGGEVAVTDIEQKPPSPGWTEWPMYQEIAEKTQERMLEANFRKVVGAK